MTALHHKKLMVGIIRETTRTTRTWKFQQFKWKWTMLRPRVPGDPRSCQIDGRTISTNIDS